MIDTVVLTGTLNPVHFGEGVDAEARWHTSATGGRVRALDYGPGPWRLTINEEGAVDLRLSIPRLLNTSGMNYPIPPLAQWDSVKTAQEVVEWVGIEKPRRERVAHVLARLWRTSWGVRSVAFAVDVYSGNVPDVLRALSNNKQRSPSQTWGGLQPEGIQWQSSMRRVQLYDKSREIENRIPRLHRDPDSSAVSRETRKVVASHARSHIRFEVTLRGATQVRRLAGLEGGLLPTLDWVGRTEVGAYALTKEARALGLSPYPTKAPPDPWEACDTLDGSPIINNAAPSKSTRCINDRPHIRVRPQASVTELTRQIALLSSALAGGRSQRSSATATRILSAATFALVSQHMTREQLQRELRMTDSVYYDQRRFLEGLGLNILGGDGLEDHRRLESFAEELFLELGGAVDSISAPPRREESAEGPAQVVLAPWAREIVFEPDIGQADKRTASEPPR